MNNKHYISAGLTLALCLAGGCNTKALNTGTTGPTLEGNPEESARLEMKGQNGQLNSMESQGIALIKNGELDKAYEVYKKIAGLSYYRGQGQRMTPLAMLLRDIHDYADLSRCVQWCRDFIQENPSLVDSAVAQNMAVIFARTNNFQEAAALLEPFLEKPDVSSDLVHDYSMYCLNILENYQLDDARRAELLSRAKEKVEEMGEKWGKNQRYYVAKGDYYTVARDFHQAREAYEQSIHLQKSENHEVADQNYDDYDESLIQLARAKLLSFELGVATWDIQKSRIHLERIIEAYEETDPETYDRFSPARVFALLFMEYFTDYGEVKSWQVERLMKEHRMMEEKGLNYPRLSKKMHQSLYQFLVSREKGDYQTALHHLDRLIGYAKVTHDCPTYHVVDIPVAISTLKGYKAQLYLLDGQNDKAVEAYQEALEYLPVNQIAKRELEKLARL